MTLACATPGPVRSGPGLLERLLDILLHIGAHRTGTTTLQRHMAQQSVPLARRGVAVWGPDRLRDGRLEGLLSSPDRVTPATQWAEDLACERVAGDLAQQARSGVCGLILSEENLIGTMRHNLRTGLLYPHVRFRLDRIARALGPAVTRVALGIRSYESYWTSVLGFAARRGLPTLSPGARADLATQPLRWRHLIADTARAFPKADVMVFPFETMAGLPAAQLAALTGQPGAAPALDDPIWANRGRACRDGTAFECEDRRMMRRDYAADIAWLKAGADGLARLVDTPASLPDRHTTARGMRDDEWQSSVG